MHSFSDILECNCHNSQFSISKSQKINCKVTINAIVYQEKVYDINLLRRSNIKGLRSVYARTVLGIESADSGMIFVSMGSSEDNHHQISPFVQNFECSLLILLETSSYL